MITYSRLRQLLHYDPETGIFTRLITTHAKAKVGDVAGWTKPNGYVEISLDSEKHYGHRLAWLYMTGSAPIHNIDHRDRNTGNNRWGNLRQATQSQNLANTGIPKHNTSGFKGVSFFATREKWVASIRIHGTKKTIGYFESPEAAHEAYKSALLNAHGEFARAA